MGVSNTQKHMRIKRVNPKHPMNLEQNTKILWDNEELSIENVESLICHNAQPKWSQAVL